jgi:hypothetical protein
MAHRAMTPGKQYGGVAVSWVLALFCSYLAYRAWDKERRLAIWPSVPAVIVSSSIEQTISGSEGGAFRSRSMRPALRFAVSYRYQVAGRLYRGDRVSNHPPEQILRQSFDPPGPEMAALRERYAAGSEVVVYYDPDHPDRSFLYYRGSWAAAFMAGVALVFWVVGAVLLRSA